MGGHLGGWGKGGGRERDESWDKAAAVPDALLERTKRTNRCPSSSPHVVIPITCTARLPALPCLALAVHARMQNVFIGIQGQRVQHILYCEQRNTLLQFRQ